MKTVLAAAAAVAALGWAGAGFAQSNQELVQRHADYIAAHPSRCATIPAAPELADGATARPNAMDQSTQAYNAWLTSMQEVLACQQQEKNELVIAANQALALAQARNDTFNAGVRQRDAACQQWMGELREFYTRNRRPLPENFDAMCGAAPAQGGN